MPSVDWEPTPDDVGAILRARTVDDDGNELGTFTPDTRPTNEEVDTLSQTAVSKVYSKVGNVPEKLQPRARHVAALRCAMLVELSYFPNEINTGRSPYKQLKDEFAEDLADLLREVNDFKSDGEIGEPSALLPSFYSDPCDELVGFRTEW